MKPLNFHVFNNSQVSREDMSGGEKIAMEFSRRWARKNNVFVYTSNIGKSIWRKYQIPKIKYVQVIALHDNENILTSYSKRVICSLRKIPSVKLKPGLDVIYSASDFWPDAIPAFFLKIIYPDILWIAGFYLFAPKPWQKDSPYKDNLWNFTRGLIYWLSQLPVYFLVKNQADRIFVTSKPDVGKFITEKRDESKIIVVQGGVDIARQKKYFKDGKGIPVRKRKYDACFVGRLHYQKGILELIDIWHLVCQKKHLARLAVIGIGPLYGEVVEKIKRKGLERNIELFGFMDGSKKHKIYKNTKVIVHPASYDSGGMAAAEGMAFEIPAVSFNLEALKTYYPKGMLKAEIANNEDFAAKILRLLDDPILYKKTAVDARKLAFEVWDWEKRFRKISDLWKN